MRDYIVSISFAAALIVLIVAAIVGQARQNAKEDEFYSRCTFTGQRVETGWNGGVIWQYECGGVPYERRRPKHYD